MTPETRERWMASRTKHGGYLGGKENPEHYIWRTMLSRCGNPRAKDYARYGARGIRVCERWQSYELFLEDMGLRPTSAHTIERRNNAGDYEPGNCHWDVMHVQNRNKRNNRWFSDGIHTLILSDWAEKLGMSKQRLLYRWEAWGTFVKGIQFREVPLGNT